MGYLSLKGVLLSVKFWNISVKFFKTTCEKVKSLTKLSYISTSSFKKSCKRCNVLQKSWEASTCYKNPKKPSCIDLIFTKRPRSFHECHITETRISDFHKMTVTAMKIILKSKVQLLYTTGMIKGSIHKVFAKTSLLICMKKMLI